MAEKEQYSKLSSSLHKYIILHMYKFAYKDTQIHMLKYIYHISFHEIIIPLRTGTDGGRSLANKETGLAHFIS